MRTIETTLNDRSDVSLASVNFANRTLTVEGSASVGVGEVIRVRPGEGIAVDGKVGISEFYADVSPAQKSKKIAELQRKHAVVGMTGDGINDAPPDRG